MTEGTVTIIGLPVPAVSPLLVGIVIVHTAVGLACVIAALIAMASTKGPGRHAWFGRIYYWTLAFISGSATVLAATRSSEDAHLFVLGALAFASGWLGLRVLRAARPHRLALHMLGMGTSFILLLTAFYVDNGRNLPMWRELPQLAFWLVPALIGVPIMAWTWRRHPLLRGGRQKH